jgi:chromosome segregation ATPase
MKVNMVDELNPQGNETVTTTPESQTPTPNPEVEQLKQELAKTKEKADAAEKGLRTAHQTLTEKDKRLKEAENLNSRIEGLEAKLKVAVGVIAQRVNVSQESLDEPNNQKDLLAEYNKVEQEQETRRKQKQLKEEQDEYAKQADTVWHKAVDGLGLKEEDDDYWYVFDALKDGNLKKAEVKVGKLEKAKTPEVKTEEKTVDIETEVNKRLKVELEKRGLLKQDVGNPAGSGGQLTPEMVSKMSPQEKWERRNEIAKLPIGL